MTRPVFFSARKYSPGSLLRNSIAVVSFRTSCGTAVMRRFGSVVVGCATDLAGGTTITMTTHATTPMRRGTFSPPSKVCPGNVADTGASVIGRPRNRGPDPPTARPTTTIGAVKPHL
jgi:hypothetical protein